MENRLERKYILNNNVKSYDFIKLLNYNFIEQHKERVVHSIYFDTPDLNSFNENIEGFESRYKVRIRWYNNDYKSAKIEIKTKENLVGKKLIYKLDNFNQDVDLLEYIKKIQINSDIQYDLIPYILNTLPISYNNYSRKYFESFDKKIRITIDTNLKFKRLFRYSIPKLNQMNQIDYSILEIKYKPEDEDLVSRILSNTFLVLRKFSKYTAGVLAN
jgi:SPX domain protein involved in polyphosphate accumulation